MDYDPKIFPIGIFDGHLVPFGAKSQLRPNTRQAFIRENLHLYTRPLSIRPEVNDGYMKPFGGELKGWRPQHQPKPKPEKPKKKKKAKKKAQYAEPPDSEEIEERSDIVNLDIATQKSDIEQQEEELKSVAGSVTTEEEDFEQNEQIFNQSLPDLVKKEHRLNESGVIKYLQDLITCSDKLQDPLDDIQVIFDKIQKWKKSIGDLDMQEKEVTRRLKNTEMVKIHNVKSLFLKMKELQKLIGLTQDEITIIIYTSLDHDYLPHLLVLSGEFLKWFNLNFEGESREELDFLDNKLEIWTATCSLSRDILGEKNRDIFNAKWWSKLRFKHFGEELAVKLKDTKLLREMRQLFKMQDDRLSYYDLFQFIDKKLKISLQNWEEDALEGRLDRLGMAFIEFNEFNEFSREYGLDWGEPLLENDLEDILDAKLNLSYKRYRLTEDDYFQGCKTMLTSEKAALAKCRKVSKRMKRKGYKKYKDKDFGPKSAQDEKGHRFSLYKTGKVPSPGYPEPKDIRWVNAQVICQPGETMQFVDDGAASNDCRQGKLGDCWLISAMSTLVTRDELLVGGRRGMEYDPNMIVDKDIASILSNGVYPPIFHRYRSKGLYVIRIFKNFRWIYVLIDDRIPVSTKNRKPVFGSCTSGHEMWVSLVEKAYAKLHGCYGNLQSGYVDEGIQELSGFQPEKILIRNEANGIFPHRMIQNHYGGSEGFWKFLMARKQDNCLLGCSIMGNGKVGQLMLDGQPTGLILNHAYGISDIIELTKEFKLLRLRNPWGHTEWTGAWSGDSPEMRKHKNLLLNYIASLTPDEQFPLDADDGTFLIHYDDWKDIFSTLFLNNDFPEDWTGVRFKSQWNQNCGGLPCKYEKPHLEKYARNPQFLIKPVNDCEIMISMTQTGGRLPVFKGCYYDYPFAETLFYAQVAIFKISEEEEYLHQFDKDKIAFMSPIRRERENSGRVQLKKGQKYVIVCSTEIQGQEGEFYLSIYINQYLRDVQIKRIFHPLDNVSEDEVLPQFIPEEAEKLVNQTPLWKLELVRESLKYMITDEDVGAMQSSESERKTLKRTYTPPEEFGSKI